MALKRTCCIACDAFLYFLVDARREANAILLSVDPSYSGATTISSSLKSELGMDRRAGGSMMLSR